MNVKTLKILDAGHTAQGNFTTVLHDGEHAFIHYQLSSGFMAFQVMSDELGMILNNRLADIYEKEDAKHGKQNAKNPLAPKRRAR